ncbi:MAG TPA: PBP1A family penicillin-binding protein, partial [Thermoanaerobaculia bacterium]
MHDAMDAPPPLVPVKITLKERFQALWATRSGRWLVLAAAAGVVILALTGAAWQTCGVSTGPDVRRLTAYQASGASVVLDRHGEAFSQLTPLAREVVPLKSLPPYVVDAFLAIEDRRFYSHAGLDWFRAIGSALANVRSGGFGQGGSTITMQLARNVFPEAIPGEERTARRKLLEIRVAQDIESRFRKDEILELYLNHIYFGNGARGIQAAAKQYFRRPAARLTLAQAALLAALPKAPTHYDPRRHPDAARERRNLVLTMMAKQGKLQTEEAERAERTPLGVTAPPRSDRRAAGLGRYFVEEVRRELEERFGDQLYQQPLRITTTLDARIQRAAEEELDHQLRVIEHSGRYGGEEGKEPLQGAVVMLGAQDGDVLAWVGGRDFNESSFDRVSRAHRQAGSAWKPFVYAAAIADGWALSQPLEDEPLAVPLARGRVWEPKNFGGEFDGAVSMRDALVHSKNVPTVRLALAVGLGPIAQVARTAGIKAPIPELPSMPLGTVSVSPLELTAAYTAFAGLGTGVTPRLVLRVETMQGRVLWETQAERRPVLDPAVAYLVDEALRDALDRGTAWPARRAGFTGVAAGKTGTSTDGNDVWFIGFTQDVVAGVWIGFDQPSPVADQATGGRLAAPLWGRLLARTYEGRRPPQRWPAPPGVVGR